MPFMHSSTSASERLEAAPEEFGLLKCATCYSSVKAPCQGSGTANKTTMKRHSNYRKKKL